MQHQQDLGLTWLQDQMQYIGPQDDPKGWPPLARAAASAVAAPSIMQVLLCSAVSNVSLLQCSDICRLPCCTFRGH